jgi:hypothetical protein
MVNNNRVAGLGSPTILRSKKKSAAPQRVQGGGKGSRFEWFLVMNASVVVCRCAGDVIDRGGVGRLNPNKSQLKRRRKIQKALVFSAVGFVVVGFVNSP